MLSHDVAFGSECCKPVTDVKHCEVSSERANCLLTRRAASKEVQYDALTKSQQGCVDVPMIREWDKWNEFGVTKLCKKQLNATMKRNPDQKIVGTRWVQTEKVIQGKQDYKARQVVQRCQDDNKGYIKTDAPTGERRLLHSALSSSSRRLGTTTCWTLGVPPVG